MPPLTPRGRRAAGIALLAYGATGLLVLTLVGVVIGGTVNQVSVVGGRLGEQREQLLATLRSTSQTMRDASTGVGNVGQSLAAARTSADHAAGLARSLTGTLHDLSAAMHLQIFGTEPLVGLASGFDNAASQSDQLATDLDQVASALAQNAGDLDSSRQDLAALGSRVDLLVASVETTSFGPGPDPFIVELVFFGLLVWLALPALGSLVLGLALLVSRPARGLPVRQE